MRSRFFVFYLVTMLYWFSMYTYVPLLSPYVQAMGGSLAMAGIVIGSYGFAQMLIRIPLGIWSDRVGRRKPFIIAGMALATLSSLAFAVTSSVGMALVARSLAGVAAASWVTFTVLFSSYHAHDKASFAMGTISFYTSLGQMAATALGGVLAQSFGWHAAFWLGAVVGAVGFGLSFAIKESEGTQTTAPVRLPELVKVGRDKVVLGVSALAVLAQVITFSTMFGFTPQAAVHLGASKADLSLLTFVSTLPNAIASLYGGRVLVRKLGEQSVVALGFALTMVFTALIPFAHSLPFLYISQALNGFGQGLCMPVLMALSIKHIAPQRRATAMGFFQAIYSLGMFGGPVLAGLIGDYLGLNGSFFAVAAVSLIAVLLTYKLTPKRQLQRVSP